MKRAEVDWIEPPAPTVGVAEAVVDERAPESIAAVLWVPDPEQRRGWREFYIRRQGGSSKPNARPIGFGKPR